MGRRRGGVSGSVVAAALVAVSAVLVLGPPAAADVLADEDLSLSFSGMFPGDTRERSTVLEVPVSAEVGIATFDVLPGSSDAFDWDVRLCGAGSTDCVSVDEGSEGTELAAGRYTLRVAVELDADARASSPEDSSAIRGQLRLVEAGSAPPSDRLPDTGSPLVSMAATAAAFFTTGLFLILLVARRRRADEEEAAR